MKYLIILLFVFVSCTSTRSVMVIDSLGSGYFHVVGMTDTYSDVVKLPKDTKEGDIVKIKDK